jgi:hypothetical protein
MNDLHQHYCRQCRTPWEHDGAGMIDNPTIVAAHKCPNCSTPGWVVFYGNETHEEMCELEALLEISESEGVPDILRYQAEQDFRRMAQRLHRPNEPPYQEPRGWRELLDIIGRLER